MRTHKLLADGTEDLRITSGRRFTYNGRKFLVGDVDKCDIKDGRKYCLYEVRKGNRLEPMFWSIKWDLLTFTTIKDAREWVRDYEWCTRGLNDYQ